MDCGGVRRLCVLFMITMMMMIMVVVMVMGIRVSNESLMGVESIKEVKNSSDVEMDEGVVQPMGGIGSGNRYAAIRQWLDPHNAARAKVGVPPLVWDEKVFAYARWWANKQLLLGGCKMQHSGPKNPYGENIFWGRGKNWLASEVVQDWVNEKNFYHYENNTCDPGKQCGHYTQIVWRTTQRLGCARVRCVSGDIFMVCEYDPRGNYYGTRPY